MTPCEAPRNARSALQIVRGLGCGIARVLARLPRHVAHGVVWIGDEQSPDLHPPIWKQLPSRLGLRYARRCA